MGAVKEATFRETRGDHPTLAFVPGPFLGSQCSEKSCRTKKALFPTQDAGKGLSLQTGLPHPTRWPEIQARACGRSRYLGSGGLEGHEAEP